jgi:hypothetical protein
VTQETTASDFSAEEVQQTRQTGVTHALGQDVIEDDYTSAVEPLLVE